jgi:hypothetical protein
VLGQVLVVQSGKYWALVVVAADVQRLCASAAADLGTSAVSITEIP